MEIDPKIISPVSECLRRIDLKNYASLRQRLTLPTCKIVKTSFGHKCHFFSLKNASRMRDFDKKPNFVKKRHFWRSDVFLPKWLFCRSNDFLAKWHFLSMWRFFRLKRKALMTEWRFGEVTLWRSDKLTLVWR